MSVLYVIFLTVMFVSYVKSDVLPGVACVCLGTNSYIKHSPKVNLADIPDRCKVVIIGENNFNKKLSDNDDGVIKDENNFNKEPYDDDAAIKALKAANKIVYMEYNCPLDDNYVPIVSDPMQLDTFIQPMLKYLKDNNIEGVILSNLYLNSGQIPDLASKINTLISKIRESVPSINIGLYLNGNDSNRFNNKQIYDFTLTNTTVDFYVVDLWSVESICLPDLNKSGGRQPIKSNDPNVLPLETVINYIINSSLEKSKLVVFIYDLPTLTQNTDSNGGNAPSYSDYCKRTGSEGLWCADTSQILYDKVTFLKNHFKGLMIQYLDLDDTTNTCECGKFPVANTFIDAWEEKPLILPLIVLL